MRDMRAKSELEKKVTAVVLRLPPMPENIERLLRATPGPGADVKQAAQIVADDPGLCAELLHLANVCCARAASVDTIEEAIARMGIEPLIQLTGASYVNDAIRDEFAALTHLDEYFAHSREISRTCRILADMAGLPMRERQMYSVAGLLHDIGRLIIMIAADRTAAPLMGTSWDEMTTIVQSEQEVLGMNHCDVGREICGKWSFSPIMQEGVLRHHTPLVKGDFSFPGALIFVAHFVAASDFTGEILARIVPADLFSRLLLSPADIERARDRYHAAPARRTPDRPTAPVTARPAGPDRRPRATPRGTAPRARGSRPGRARTERP